MYSYHNGKFYKEIPQGEGEMSLKGQKLGTINGKPRMLSADEHFHIFGSKQP